MLVALGAHARISVEHARQRHPRGATQKDREELIFPSRALPVIAPAAVGQGAVAAHSLHRRPGLRLGLHQRRRRLLGTRGSVLAHSRWPGWGAGGGLYHSPPGVNPPFSTNGEGARAVGTQTRGVPSPARLSRGGAAAATRLLIYLFPMCAPRCRGNRWIFSGVCRAPGLSNLARTEMAKRLHFLLVCGESRMRSPYSGPFCRDTPYRPPSSEKGNAHPSPSDFLAS